MNHFVLLLNAIISQFSVAELNTVWADILYKLGGKDREPDRSYRTIICCPLIAKALDSYTVELYDVGWSEMQLSNFSWGSPRCSSLPQW